MLNSSNKLAPNDGSIAATIIEGEAILIRLSDGTYYSMRGVGALIWELVEQAFSVEDIVAHISSCYIVDADQAERDLQRVAKQLLEEELVIIKENDSSQCVPRGNEGERPETNTSELLPYEKPSLQVYRDMRDLLALDPPAPGMEQVDWKAP